MKKIKKPLICFVAGFLSLACLTPRLYAAKNSAPPALSARSAVVVDPKNGSILYGKNPHLKLAPASTVKVMTALIALERLPYWKWVAVSRNATNVSPSKADLTRGAKYRAIDLVVACLVSSSNDAAVALAEDIAGSEEAFAVLMNAKAKDLNMKNTHFVNATGLPLKGKRQYTTAYDLALLLRRALKDRRVDSIMGITRARIVGTDKKNILLRSHNKMLWRTPGSIKGKTGWTIASRHTFVGTNYGADKKVVFAMLSSQKPWTDIERLWSFGLTLKRQNWLF